MTLGPGARLGAYEIVAPLGAGGMGEVWRARDTKLDREVALKFLPESFAREPERLARFEREAKVLASLNHPGIAAIYGFHEHEGHHFLAMELVPGDELKKGTVPFSEIVDIARQIAEALEVAHEHGIVHRDLKPANIKLTPDGKVKVLDFGLAKALDPVTASGAGRDAANSPTITSLGTVAGVILGTAAYMSPEQARGRSVDKRADIWAFGCVFYEMLAGKLAFAGETISDTMAAVLTREPDWSAIPPTVPARVRELLERCLRKDPRDRLRDIGDARIELTESARSGPSPAAPSAAAARSRFRPLLAAIAVAGALAGGIWYGRQSSHTEPPAFRPLTFGRGAVHSARFAPDGQTVIYGAAYEGRPLALFSTRVDGFESRPIDVPSSDVAGMSRDGQMALLLGRHYQGSWLRVGTLAQVALAGGAPREILEEVYDADISPDGKEFAVVVTEGDDQVLQYPIGKEIARSQGWISQPRIAPDGKRVAYVDHRVWADDLGEIKIADGGKIAVVAPERQYTQGLCWSPDGREVWFTIGDEIRGGVLMKVTPGEAPRVVLRSPTLLRLQDLSKDGHVLLLSDETRATVAGQLAGDTSERIYSFWDNDQVCGISQDGTTFVGSNASVVVDGEYAVFFRRRDAPPVQLAMGIAAGLTPDGRFAFTTNLTGNQTKLTVRPIGPGQPKTIDLGGLMLQVTARQRVTCSADGRRIALVLTQPGGGSAMYVMDLDGGSPRLVSPEGATSGIISPDGSRVVVSDAKRGFYVVPAAGGEAVPIEGVPKNDIPLAWSPDGRAILSGDRTLPPRIYRTDLVGGRRELVRELVSADPAGLVYGWLILSPDGRFYLQRLRRMLTTVEYVTLG